MEHKLENWVVFPRKIASDYRNGNLTLSEWMVYSWLRQNANPYGIATATLSGIAEDMFGNEKKKNNANKILLSLKKKKFIYYETRRGSRGSFDIHFGDFILPTGHTRTLDKYFQSEEVRTSPAYVDTKKSVSEQNLPVDNQNLKDIKSDIRSILNLPPKQDTVRTYNNENDNKKE